MDEHTEKFTPELVDEQVDQLLTRRLPASPEGRIVDDLRQMYEADEHSLNAVWQRLGLEESPPASMERQPGTLRVAEPKPRPKAGAKIFQLERNRQMRQSHKRPLVRALSFIAAACVVALIVGSMLWISNQAHQGKSPHTASPRVTQQQAALPPGVYASNANGLFRLNGQTHQTLWQRALKDIAKIIPAGKVVYILQSSQSANGTNAVVALDASSGKTLWARPFAVQKHGSDRIFAQTTDLVLAQDQLYVGWQSWDVSAQTSVGHIYMLSASDGRQLASYPATAALSALAAGDGVLAASADSSLQVYDPASGKSLWHVSIKGPTNKPVVSLSVVDSLVYAVITTNNEVSGAGVSYIVAYNARTGARVWKSPNFAGDALSHFTVVQHVVYFGVLGAHSQDSGWTGNVYAYDVQHNRQLWNRPVRGGVQNSPIVSNGLMYVATDDGTQGHARLIALTASTGAMKWQLSLPDGFAGTFCISSGIVYAVNVSYSSKAAVPDGLYAFSAASGSELWEDTQLAAPSQSGGSRFVASVNVAPTE